MGKAIQEELVCKTELEGIAYDKQTQMYRTAVQMHMKVLQTKGQDIIDAGTYLKKLAKVSAGRVPVE